MYDWQRREQERQARIKQQMKEQDQRRFEDPDHVDDLTKVWVVYQWHPANTEGTDTICFECNSFRCAEAGGSWVLAGFRRRRKRRKPQTFNRFFAKVRRKLEIRKDIPVMLLDLQTAQLLSRRKDDSWLYAPPKHQVSTRPSVVMRQSHAPKVKRVVTRIRKNIAPVFHKKITRYIVLGRRTSDRDPTFWYLSPLRADRKLMAMNEAKQWNTLYNDVRVVPVAEISKRLRNAMHKARRVYPGVRLRWPEPVALEAILGMPATALRAVPQADVAYHVEQLERVARRAAKSKKDKAAVLVHALAVLMLLYDLLPDTTFTWRAA